MRQRGEVSSEERLGERGRETKGDKRGEGREMWANRWGGTSLI